jgi:hypothetical protein
MHYYALHAPHCLLVAYHYYSLHTTYCSPPATYSILRTTHYTLHTTHHILRTTHYTRHCSPPTTHYTLPRRIGCRACSSWREILPTGWSSASSLSEIAARASIGLTSLLSPTAGSHPRSLTRTASRVRRVGCEPTQPQPYKL